MTKPAHWPTYLLTLLPPGVVLFLHGYLGSTTRPLADDFCSLYYSERFDLLRSIWYFRLTWSGRYSAYGADWVATKLFGAYNIFLAPPLLLIFWLAFLIAGIYVASRAAFPQKGNQSASILLGTVCLFLVLSLSPDLPQSIYWWNGLRTHTLPLVVFTGYAVLFLLWPVKLQSKGWIWLAGWASFSLLFASSGFSETFAVGQFFLLLFLIALKLADPSQRKLDAKSVMLIAGLLGTLTALIVIVTAPGNAVRRLELPPPPDLGTLVSVSLQGYLQFLAGISFTPEKVTSLAGAILLAAWAGTKQREAPAPQGWRIAACAVAGILISLACFPPGVYGYSAPPPPRTQIIPVYFLTGCLLYAGFLAGKRWGDKFNSGFIRSGLTAFAILCLGFSAFVQSRALYQVRNTYIEYARTWDALDARILQAKADGDESITIPAVENWARLNVLNDNPRFWVNVCYSNYYGIPVFGPSPD